MNWFAISPLSIFAIIVSTLGMLSAIILFTRINGLRTFSKMSSYDFVITIAFGSIIASTILTPRPSLFEGALALGMLIFCQYAVSWLRLNRGAANVVDNEPLILMRGGTFFEEVLTETRVTKDDIYAKLREANVLDFDQVLAVVLETTGDISVLHGEDKVLNRDLLTGVKNINRFDAEA